MLKSKIKYFQIVFIAVSFLIFFIIILRPNIYLKSVSNGIMLWATIILPGLIPFMFLSKILSTMSYTYMSTFVLSKVTKKCFFTPKCSGYIYFMSILSGYPLGAKLTKDFFDNNQISLAEAKKIVAFCSTSGPIFMIGSVGVSLLGSNISGVIIFCSHILGSFINGFVFRGKKSAVKDSDLLEQSSSKDILNDSMYSTILSSMLVGGFITMTFLIIDILTNFGIIHMLGNILDKVLFFNKLPIGQYLASGMIEVTRGCLDLSQSSLTLPLKTIIASGLTAFGGLSVHLQCMGFLSSIGIKYSYFLKTKLAHTIITVVLATLFSFILF